MTALTAYQFELSGLAFGAGTVYPLAKVDGLGKAGTRDQDADIPSTDGVLVGIDRLTGREVTFEGSVLVPGDAEATLAALAALEDVWDAETTRLTPGAVLPLRMQLPGRPGKVLYGRPRRWDPDVSDVALGVVPFVATFLATDPRLYGDSEMVETVSLVPPTSGGMIAPFVFPLTTTIPVSVPGAVTVGGTRGAWPVITITGPITDPTVQVTGQWSLVLRLSLAADQAVTIDTRPWRRSITRDSDGASFAGALSRTSVRLSAASIPPGTHEVALRGTDATGTSWMRVAWRDTYSSI